MNSHKHDRIFRRGVELDRGTVKTHPETVGDVLACERLIEKYSAKFHSEAVVAFWVQPFGGPVMYIKVHKKSDADSIHRAYENGEVKDVCPELGVYRDKKWCKSAKARIFDSSLCTRPEKIYPPEFIQFLREFYSEQGQATA